MRGGTRMKMDADNRVSRIYGRYGDETARFLEILAGCKTRAAPLAPLVVGTNVKKDKTINMSRLTLLSLSLLLRDRLGRRHRLLGQRKQSD